MTADTLIGLSLGRQYPPPSTPASPAKPNSKGFISSRTTTSTAPSLVNTTTLKAGNGARGAGGRAGSALTVAAALLALAVSAALSMQC
jgi:hypothetical protein